MSTSNSKQRQATYQKCAARNLMKNKSPGVSIWKTAKSEWIKTKHTTAIHKGNYIWYKEDDFFFLIKPRLRTQERSGMRRVFYSNNAWCMRHKHNERLATGERTESQTPQRPRIPLRRIPADYRLMWLWDRLRLIEESQKGHGRRRGIWKCIRNLNSYIKNAWKKIKLRPASHVSRLIPKPRIFITVAPSCVASHNNEASGEFQSTIFGQNNKVPQLDVMASSARLCLWFIGHSALILLTFAV